MLLGIITIIEPSSYGHNPFLLYAKSENGYFFHE